MFSQLFRLFLCLASVDAVSYLLDDEDKEQGGYDGPNNWPYSKVWEPALRRFSEMVISGIDVDEGVVHVVFFVYDDFPGLDVI